MTENESPGTYLTGQTLKAQTFASQLPNFGAGVVLVEPLGSLANVGSPETAAEPQSPSTLIKGVDRIHPAANERRFIIEHAARLNARQSWEGTVVECLGNTFRARVTDRTNPSNPDEFVIFELDEISEDDRGMVETGASFYWTIGTERSPAGQIRNVDMVNFRRLPAWRASSFREADREAQQTMELLSEWS